MRADGHIQRICAILTGPTPTELSRQMELSKASADLWELRVDLWDPELRQVWPSLQHQLMGNAIVFTDVRWATQSTEQILQGLQECSSWNIDWIDLPWHLPDSLVEEIRRIRPTVRVLRSTHADVSPQQLRLWPRGDLWKVAPQCPNLSQWLAWESWIQEQWRLSPDRPVLFQPQGEWGAMQRIWAANWKQPWTYAPSHPWIPGQIGIEKLEQQYWQGSRSAAKAFVLLGDPVEQSRGPVVHNCWMGKTAYPARYGTFRVPEAEWQSAWPRLRSLLSGGAITTPLKQVAYSGMDWVDPIAQRSGAVNTFLVAHGKACGFNTDGPAVLDALAARSCCSQSRVLILGTGGVARACAASCRAAGMEPLFASRTPDRYQQELTPLGACVHYAAVESLASDITAVVQSTTCGFKNDLVPMQTDWIDERHVVVEMVQRETPFAAECRQRGATLISGVEIFVRLSAMQAEIWTEGSVKDSTAWPIILESLDLTQDAKSWQGSAVLAGRST